MLPQKKIEKRETPRERYRRIASVLPRLSEEIKRLEAKIALRKAELEFFVDIARESEKNPGPDNEGIEETSSMAMDDYLGSHKKRVDAFERKRMQKIDKALQKLNFFQKSFEQHSLELENTLDEDADPDV